MKFCKKVNKIRNMVCQENGFGSFVNNNGGGL